MLKKRKIDKFSNYELCVYTIGQLFRTAGISNELAVFLEGEGRCDPYSLSNIVIWILSVVVWW